MVPVLSQTAGDDDDTKIDFAIHYAREQGIVKSGDIVIAATGQRQEAGATDIIRVLRVDV